MPREAPVMNIVFPFNFLESRYKLCQGSTFKNLPSVPHFLGAKSI